MDEPRTYDPGAPVTDTGAGGWTGSAHEDAESAGSEEPAAGQHAGLNIQGMLAQLQGMIEQVAAASAPALREVAAKAAELAAVAADHAGPIAHTLADKTEQVGHIVAGKASDLASSLRAGGAEGGVDAPAEDSPTDGA